MKTQRELLRKRIEEDLKILESGLCGFPNINKLLRSMSIEELLEFQVITTKFVEQIGLSPNKLKE